MAFKKQTTTAVQDDPFLPADYERPVSGGSYMKFRDGDNQFRILSRPIIGNVGWAEVGGKRTPVRKRMGEEFAPGEVLVDAKNKIRHFWAMPVWNYGEARVQILEITQSTVQEAMEKLVRAPKWGSPLGYDITVERSGEGMDTSYTVRPEPKEPLAREIAEAWAEVAKTFNLEALYSNGDPFDAQPSSVKNGAADPAQQRRFFALLGEAAQKGLVDAEATKPTLAGKSERRRIVQDALGGPVEPADMTEDHWARAAEFVRAMIERNTPPDDDSDIPF